MPTGHRDLLSLVFAWRPAAPVRRGAESLRLELDGLPARPLRLVGAPAGLIPLEAAPRNRLASGAGVLRVAADGRAAWQAPGSGAPGPAVDVSAGGSFSLRDGADADKWLRLRAVAGFLPASGEAAAAVRLGDRYDAATSPDDVTAGEAAAGAVADWTLTLRNADPRYAIQRLRVWLEDDAYLELSPDGVTYSAPTTEAAALALDAIAPGATIPLYCRRTIAPAAEAATAVLNMLHFAFSQEVF